MKDKLPLYAILAVAFIVGIVGFINLDSSTGAALLESNSCMCYLDYATPSRWDTPEFGSAIDYTQANIPVQIIRVRTRQPTDEFCQMQCETYFHRKMNVRGVAAGPGTDVPVYSSVIPRVDRQFV